MALLDQCLIRQSVSGELQVRLGVPLLDDYLEFVAAPCRPNTVVAEVIAQGDELVGVVHLVKGMPGLPDDVLQLRLVVAEVACGRGLGTVLWQPYSTRFPREPPWSGGHRKTTSGRSPSPPGGASVP